MKILIAKILFKIPISDLLISWNSRWADFENQREICAGEYGSGFVESSTELRNGFVMGGVCKIMEASRQRDGGQIGDQVHSVIEDLKPTFLSTRDS